MVFGQQESSSSTFFPLYSELELSPSITQPSHSSLFNLHLIMGGCVSGPKDVALNEGEEAPIETPVTQANVEEKVHVAQENKQEEAEKNEEPLVDVSDSKEEKVEAKVEEAEVVAVVETKEPEKEQVKVEAVVETKEPEKEQVEAEQPKAEEKTEATLVTV